MRRWRALRGPPLRSLAGLNFDRPAAAPSPSRVRDRVTRIHVRQSYSLVRLYFRSTVDRPRLLIVAFALLMGFWATNRC